MNLSLRIKQKYSIGINNFLLFILVLLLITDNVKAWVYFEHRKITLTAIENMDPGYKKFLDKLWKLARTGYENRLSESIILPDQGINIKYLDYASWPAIAGDHSCSAKNMVDVILNSDWILKVAKVSAELDDQLGKAENISDHINAIRSTDIELQQVDPQYATRAGANNAHFLLGLNNIGVKLKDYIRKCLQNRTEPNALGLYTWYHLKALEKIKQLRLTSDVKLKTLLARAALANEAFALHFLEDIFAAGHVAGTWGDVSLRKGSHDYYNQNGLSTVTWKNEHIVLTGDSYMRPEDAEFASKAVIASLKQLVQFYLDINLYPQIKKSYSNNTNPEDLSICEITSMPENIYSDESYLDILFPVLLNTPFPGLIKGKGTFPRFRAEIGPFGGFSAAFHAALASGGFSIAQTSPGFIGGLETNLRFGFGIEGVLNHSGDGLVFLEIGWRQDASSKAGIIEDEVTNLAGALTSSIPARSSYSARIRLPFWLIPGDLLIAAPILYLISPNTLTNMAATAVNGGLIPWQAGISTGIGRFQFVLGREVGVYFYGTGRQRDAFFLPVLVNNEVVFFILSYKSTKFDFPILEYRPFRNYSTNQSSDLMLQLSAGFDVPYGAEVLEPGNAVIPDLKPVYYISLKLLFDWRYYF